MNDTVTIRGADGGEFFYDLNRVLTSLLQLLQANRVDEAADLYSRIREDISYPLIARAQTDQDAFRQLANLFFRARDFARAAYCCEHLDEPRKAASLYEQAGDFAAAAQMFAAAGDVPRAAEMFERGCSFLDAARMYVNVATAEAQLRAAACFERATRLFDAAQCYERAGRGEQALALYQSIDDDSPDKKVAQRLARALVERLTASRAGTAPASSPAPVAAPVAVASPAAPAPLDGSDAFTEPRRLARPPATPSLTGEVCLSALPAPVGAAYRALSEPTPLTLPPELASGPSPGSAAAWPPLPVEPDTEPDPCSVERAPAVFPLALPAAPPLAPASIDLGGAAVPAGTRSVTMMEGFDALKALPLLSLLTLAELKAVYHLCSVVTLAAEELLIEAGAPAPAVWIVLGGELLVSAPSGAAVARVGRGGHVGEMGLFDDAPASVDVTVSVPGRALRLQRAGLRDMVAANDSLAARVYRMLFATLRDRLRATTEKVALST